jgi:hypothetical protein
MTAYSGYRVDADVRYQAPVENFLGVVWHRIRGARLSTCTSDVSGRQHLRRRATRPRRSISAHPRPPRVGGRPRHRFGGRRVSDGVNPSSRGFFAPRLPAREKPLVWRGRNCGYPGPLNSSCNPPLRLDGCDSLFRWEHLHLRLPVQRFGRNIIPSGLLGRRNDGRLAGIQNDTFGPSLRRVQPDDRLVHLRVSKRNGSDVRRPVPVR